MYKIVALSLCFCLLAIHADAQSSFYTHFIYDLSWENNVWQSFNDTKFNAAPGNGHACQVKWDLNQFEIKEANPIIAFFCIKKSRPENKGH